MIEQITYKSKKGIFLSSEEYKQHVDMINQKGIDYGKIAEKYLELGFCYLNLKKESRD